MRPDKAGLTREVPERWMRQSARACFRTGVLTPEDLKTGREGCLSFLYAASPQSGCAKSGFGFPFIGEATMPVFRFLLCACAALAASTSTATSFNDLVDCRLAVERIFWDAREWPETNRAPRPDPGSLIDAASLSADLAAQFAVARRWIGDGRLDARVLQAELDRMATSSQDPALLERLFAAAGNGPRAALCIALPQLLRGAALSAREAATSIDIDLSDVALPVIAGQSGHVLADIDHAAAMAGARYGHVAVWTGAEMVVWGGFDGRDVLGDGALYVPATDTWWPIATAGAPSARWFASAVWTGLDVVVWGGAASSAGGVPALGGGRYRVGNDVWSAVSTLGQAPAGRYHHVTVWTGSRMLVWGGIGNGFSVLGDGAEYDPASNGWQAMTAASPPAARFRASAVWTGTEMIVWGGEAGGGVHLGSGGRYAPGAPSWIATAAGGPSPRSLHTALWIGPPIHRMLVWGGKDGTTSPFGDGAMLDPTAVASAWTPMAVGGPSPRYFHTAVWTGADWLVWGGTPDNASAFGTGGRFDPVANEWDLTPYAAAPDPRYIHSAVWTGDRMLVWGGGAAGRPLQSGGLFDPAFGEWTPTAVPRDCTTVPGNIIPNCGFESGDPPAGWSTDAPEPILRDRFVFRGDAHSARVPLFLDGGDNMSAILRTGCLPVASPSRHRFGVHLRVDRQGSLSPLNCSVYVAFASDLGCVQFAGGEALAMRSMEDTTRWQSLGATTTIPEPSAVAAFASVGCSSSDPFDLNVDDAWLAPLPARIFADGFGD